MKVIDLLNKIANKEEIPEKIMIKGYEYRQSNGQYYCDEISEYMIDSCISVYHLNDEIEIIEEDKKIAGITNRSSESYDKKLKDIYAKINEIIDYINRG